MEDPMSQAIDLYLDRLRQVAPEVSAAPVDDRFLFISEKAVLESARPISSLICSKLRQYSIVYRKGIRFRFDQQARVEHAYDSMSHAEFETINDPQVWTEERQIPRLMNGRVPRFGATIVDLGCGPGTSTRIISRFAHPSWTIYALDLSKTLIARAKEEAELGVFVTSMTPDPRTIMPRFVNQSIAETWSREERIADGSVDLVNSSGVVGHHLQADDVAAVLAEAKRVLKRGGYLGLDSGPRFSARRLAKLLTDAGFVEPTFIRSTALDPRPKVAVRKP
jgi:SAM-dependent methyltransferase